MLTNKIDQTIDGFGFRDVEFDGRFANVEVDLAGGAAHITEIRVGHFAGTIYDAAHNGDLHSFEVFGAGFDARGHRLQVEQRSATGGASHIVGLERAAAGGLKNVIGQTQ